MEVRNATPQGDKYITSFSQLIDGALKLELSAIKIVYNIRYQGEIDTLT